MSSIILISFDIRKVGYPSMPYSIAALASAIIKENHTYSHYSVDIESLNEQKLENTTILNIVSKELKTDINYFLKFDFIAISLTSWTIEYCIAFLQMLSEYQGKVILGGYEVTSRTTQDLRATFPRADYFIRGYAEKALKNILNNHYYESNVISDPIDFTDIVSPYLSGILPTTSKKIYWETKRGCPFKCGFCEWGNATVKMVDINPKQLFSEIELFGASCIDEINILDGTFNVGKSYLDIFSKLIELTDIKITCQVKFENLLYPDGIKFIELCAKATDRVHLEFGLQTIHKKEMETIGRDNDISKIEKVLKLLKINNIDFEVSIIYAIPGLTVDSFIETIEFLITRGCSNIKAYPLSIPKNSKMEHEKTDMLVSEGKNKYNVFSVISSYSFPTEQRKDMDNIASRLNNGKLFTDFDSLPSDFAPDSVFEYKKISDYLWEIVSIKNGVVGKNFFTRFIHDYLSQTLKDIQEQDILQSIQALGHSILNTKMPERLNYINDLLKGKYFLEIKKTDYGPAPSDFGKLELIIFNKINQNPLPKKYILKARISVSNNIYVYREIQN